MIHHTCFKCKRRFELDPVFVGFELSKLKKKNPSHYQAVCPGCRAINKVSVQEMKDELEQVADEVQQMIADYEAQKAAARAEKQAKAKEKKSAEEGQPKSKSRRRLKAKS
ncbi:MAG: hypothetical protein JW953_08430 [Anaerolineae bacterium]|nr:hypothetical protein [Anaerolineae bacterium]